MRQNAKVVEHDGKLMAEVVRSEACQTCHACKFGQEERVYVDLGKLKCAIGDEVELELDDSSFSKASVIAYGVPVALFFAGLLISGRFTSADYVQGVCALAGLAIGLAIVKISEKYIKASGRYAPKVRISRENGGSNGGNTDV